MKEAWLAGALLSPLPGAVPDSYDLPCWAPCDSVLTVQAGKPVSIDPATGTRRPYARCGAADWAVFGPDCGALTLFRRTPEDAESGRLLLCRDDRPIAPLLPGEFAGPSQFAWSYSGRYLLQNTRAGGRWELWVVDGKTGDRERVPPPDAERLPPALPGAPPPAPQMGSFAPDDSAVYFSLIARGGAYDGERGIWRYDRTRRAVTRVMRGGWCSWPAVSPDGTWIAYVARDTAAETDRSDLWLVEAEGRRAVRLTSDPAISCTGRPAWSPSGDAIVIAVSRDKGLPRLHVAVPAPRK